MKTSEEIKDIAVAMSKFQAMLKPAIKDSQNPHFKSNYSDLTSVMEAIREPLGLTGLTVWQDAITEEMCVSVTTRVVHNTGQWIEFGPFSVPFGRRDAHAIGSACSYAKRYALCASLGVVSDDDNNADDDDGNAAVAKPASKPKSNPPVDFITKVQADELEFILKDCSPAKKKGMEEMFNRMGSRFEKLQKENFEQWKTSLLAERSAYQATIQNEE